VDKLIDLFNKLDDSGGMNYSFLLLTVAVLLIPLFLGWWWFYLLMAFVWFIS